MGSQTLDRVALEGGCYPGELAVEPTLIELIQAATIFSPNVIQKVGDAAKQGEVWYDHCVACIIQVSIEFVKPLR